VRDINKFSNNVMAWQVFLKVGAGGTARATDAAHTDHAANTVIAANSASSANSANAANSANSAAAENAIRQWLAGRGLDFPELVLDNGSGLSRTARLSAASLARLLAAGWDSPVMPEFIASLPIAAIDGTVKKKFAGNGFAGQAHLKTGSLDGVRGIAGYLRDRAGHRHLVVFMVNHANAGAAQPAFDALLEWLWAAPNRRRDD